LRQRARRRRAALLLDESQLLARRVGFVFEPRRAIEIARLSMRIGGTQSDESGDERLVIAVPQRIDGRGVQLLGGVRCLRQDVFFLGRACAVIEALQLDQGLGRLTERERGGREQRV
jgi:hypothetical protein